MQNIPKIFLFVLLATLPLFQACAPDDTDIATSGCDLTCENAGIVSIDCECICPDGFTGSNCEIATCDIVCQNNGYVKEEDCSCGCLAGFTGTNCELCVPNCKLNYADRYHRSETGGGLQVSDHKVILPDDYLLTGLGFNSASTLKLIGRELRNDCTLGEAAEFFDGFDPTGPLAVSYTVPDGHVITGVGFGESQDVYRLVVNYNELMQDENCDLYLGPEQLYDNGADRNIEIWLKISDASYPTRTHLLGGLGIKYSGSSNRQLDAEVRVINNF